MSTMLQANGNLWVERPWMRGERGETEYEWTGGPIVRIQTDVILGHVDRGDDVMVGDVVNIGPYAVRLLEEDFVGYAFLAMRDGWQARLMLPWMRSRRTVQLLYWVSIHIADVWGLAKMDLAQVPSWRMVKVVRWWEWRKAGKR